MKHIETFTIEQSIAEKKAEANFRHQYNSGWGKRRLNRFKRVNGKLYQLHATKGWKAA